MAYLRLYQVNYSGASYVRMPEIRALQLTDDFIWKKIIILSPQKTGISRSGSGRSVFTIKHGLTINFASFNRLLR